MADVLIPYERNLDLERRWRCSPSFAAGRSTGCLSAAPLPNNSTNSGDKGIRIGRAIRMNTRSRSKIMSRIKVMTTTNTRKARY
jgi:hypothetical protein